MSFVKTWLKQCRQAIADKDFEKAREKCDDILEEEPSNYNALVFSGLIYQNMSLIEKSENDYQKAIKTDPKMPLAWQGLINLYEKNNLFSKLIETLIYLRQISIEEKDSKNYTKHTERLKDLYQKENRINEVSLFYIGSHLKVINSLTALSKYCEILQSYLPRHEHFSLLEYPDLSPENEKQILKTIIELQENKDENTLQFLIEQRRKRIDSGTLQQVQQSSLRDVLRDSKLKQAYEDFLTYDDHSPEAIQVYTKYVSLLEKCLRCLDNKEENSSTLYSLCAKLVEKSINFALPYEILIEKCDANNADDFDSELINTFKEKFPESALSLYHDGFLTWMETKDLTKSQELFKKALEKNDRSLFGYTNMVEVLFLAKEYDAALDNASKSINLLSEYELLYNQKRTKSLCFFNLKIGLCYYHLGSNFYLDAVQCFKTVIRLQSDSKEAILGLGIIFSAEAKYPEAVKCFKKVLELDPKSDQAISKLGWVHFLQGEIAKAKEMIIEAISWDNSSAIHHFRLGRCYWEAREQKENSANAFEEFGKAARLDPSLGTTFTFLGHYFREKGDVSRAKKCYEKAVSLDILDSDAGLFLSEYYFSTGDTSSGVSLLKSVTNASTKLYWAWKRLGFWYLFIGQYPEAISSFQTALRVELTDSNCWEGLGEAYKREGRLVASLKAFNRAADLTGASQFVLFQIYNIKAKLGLFDDAIKGLKQIVENSTEMNLIFSKTLIDIYLTNAKYLYNRGLYARASQNIDQLLSVSLQLVKNGNHFPSIWKTIGDAALFYSRLESFISVQSKSNVGELTSIAREQCRKRQFNHIETLFSTWNQTETFGVLNFLILAAFSYSIIVVMSESAEDKGESWFDLAISCHAISELRQLKMAQKKEAKEFLFKCISASLKCEEKGSYWNLLGISVREENLRLSQHCFIRALEIEPNNPSYWSNMGFFYILHGDIELAGKAFTKARQVDPDWKMGWIGQAIVSLKQGTGDSIDFFQYGIEDNSFSEPESHIRYAEALYDTLVSEEGQQYINFSMCIMPLYKFLEMIPNDVSGRNLMGLVLERDGQYEKAVEYFSLDIEKISESTSTMDNVNISKILNFNKARCLLAIGKYDEASVAFSQSDIENPYVLMGWGTSLFFQGKLEDSLSLFEKVLQTSNLDKERRADICVKIGQVLYALGTNKHKELARTQFMECIKDFNDCAPALFALCAYGTVHNDEELLTVFIKEIIEMEPSKKIIMDPECCFENIFSTFANLQGHHHLSSRILSKAVHQFPWKAKLWRQLLERFVLLKKASNVSAMKTFEQTTTSFYDSQGYAKDIVYGIQLTGSLFQMNGKPSLLHFQKSILLQPSNIRSWNLLAQSMRTESSLKSLQKSCNTYCNIANFSIQQSSQKLSTGSINQLTELKRIENSLLWGQLIRADSLIMQAQFLKNSQLLHESSALLDRLINMVSNPLIQSIGFRLMAKCLWLLGNEPHTLLALKKSLLLHPTSCASLEGISQFYANIGQTKCFLQCQTEMMRMDAAHSIIALSRMALHSIELNDGDLFQQTMKQASELGVASSSSVLLFLQMLHYMYGGQDGKVKKSLEKLSGEEPCSGVIDIYCILLKEQGGEDWKRQQLESLAIEFSPEFISAVKKSLESATECLKT